MSFDIERQVRGLISFLDQTDKRFEQHQREFMSRDDDDDGDHHRHRSPAPSEREHLLTVALLRVRGCPPEGIEAATDWLWEHPPTSVDDLLAMVDEAAGVGLSMTGDGHRVSSDDRDIDEEDP